MHQAVQQLSGINLAKCRASALPRACLLTASTRPLAPWPSQSCCSITSISPNQKCSAGNYCRQYTGKIRSQDWRSGSSSSAVCCRAQAVSTTAAAAASAAFLQLEPRVAFFAQLLSNGVLLPVLGGWFLVTALSTVASRARQWCDENPDEPLSMELLGLLPAALESPTRVAVALFVTTRVLRNVAAGLAEFIHTFKPQWDSWADAAAHNVVSWLGPFDHTLLRIYTVVAVLAGARVLIKWKTIALEFILQHRASLEDSSQGQWPGAARKLIQNPHIKGSMRSASSSSMGVKPASAAATAAPVARAAVAAEDDFDEAAVMQREGSMLSVSMRPRSVTPAAMARVGATEPGVTPAAAAGRDSAAGSSVAAVGGWGGSSAARSADVPWPAQGGREGDSVERLLLPLDSILSWAIAVMAGLFAVQTVGINIQPLLAVGGASSLIIGLATQTLLTNAVMGVSIFLSRPFVPGDSITVQAAGAILVSGVVEKVTPMRTLLRTDDDVLVTLPNKTIADMIVYNKSRREARNRLVARSWERPYLKFKVKLPQKELQHLQEVQDDLRKVLKRPGVQQQSVELALAKFTDAGAELLLQCLLLVTVGSPTAQQLLLDLAVTVRKHGATLVSIL